MKDPDADAEVGDMVSMAAPHLYGERGIVLSKEKPRTESEIWSYKIRLLDGGTQHESGWVGDWGPGGFDRVLEEARLVDKEFIAEENKWRAFFTKGYKNDSVSTTSRPD